MNQLVLEILFIICFSALFIDLHINCLHPSTSHCIGLLTVLFLQFRSHFLQSRQNDLSCHLTAKSLRCLLSVLKIRPNSNTSVEAQHCFASSYSPAGTNVCLRHCQCSFFMHLFLLEVLKTHKCAHTQRLKFSDLACLLLLPCFSFQLILPHYQDRAVHFCTHAEGPEK